MTQMENEKFDNYFQTCFVETELKSAEQSFDHYRRCFTWLLPVDPKCKILDFGAGLGNLTIWLNSLGYTNIVSVDISKDQCDAAHEFGVEVIHVPTPLDFLRNRLDTFDVIFMSDVIEHIPKSQMISYLEAAKSALHDNGYVAVKTENVSSPTGIYQHHMDFTHEYNFVEKSLKQLFKIVGFREIEVRGHSMPWPRRPWLWWRPVFRFLYVGIVKAIYAAEQPRGKNNPRIFSNSLIARALK